MCTKQHGLPKRMMNWNVTKTQEKKQRTTMDMLLACHVPIEISSLIDYFLKADKSNSISAQVTGKRKCEVGLVVPVRFTACTATRRQAQILDSELNKYKAKFVHLELIYEPGLRSYPTNVKHC